MSQCLECYSNFYIISSIERKSTLRSVTPAQLNFLCTYIILLCEIIRTRYISELCTIFENCPGGACPRTRSYSLVVCDAKAKPAQTPASGIYLNTAFSTPPPPPNI